MDRPRIYIDCNEMIEFHLYLLSKGDSTKDSSGNAVHLYEGLHVHVYSDDADDDGTENNLLAEGTAVLNTEKGWSKDVKWCVRISDDGFRHER